MRLATERLQNLPQNLPGWALPAVAGVSALLLLAPGIVMLKRSLEQPAQVESAAPSSGLLDSYAAEPIPTQAPALDYAALAPVPESFPRAFEESWRGGTPTPSAGAGREDLASLACIIEPHSFVDVGSPVTGVIRVVHVERADFVEKGQILVELDSKVAQAAVNQARARAAMNEAVLASRTRLELGERNFARVNKLYEQDALSLDLRDEAETERELARLELDRARAEKQLASLELEQALAVLRRRTIRSPITGVVVERSMDPGERVQDETVMKIAQIDPLRVEVILPSAMFGSIEKGTRATVIPEFPGDTVHVASVTVVDRIIDAASGTFGVRLELPNPDHAIPGGVHCNVRFIDP